MGLIIRIFDKSERIDFLVENYEENNKKPCISAWFFVKNIDYFNVTLSGINSSPTLRIFPDPASRQSLLRP
jgi:hypothetical protein